MKKNKNKARVNRRKFVSKGRAATVARSVKMKIKKGDTVVVVSGKDKGKKGEVLRVFPTMNRVVVDGVALVKRHYKKTSRGQSGRIAEHPSRIHASNVMVLDPDTKKGTRVGREQQNGRTVRIAKKSKTVLK